MRLLATHVNLFSWTKILGLHLRAGRAGAGPHFGLCRETRGAPLAEPGPVIFLLVVCHAPRCRVYLAAWLTGVGALRWNLCRDFSALFCLFFPFSLAIALLFCPLKKAAFLHLFSTSRPHDLTHPQHLVQPPVPMSGHLRQEHPRCWFWCTFCNKACLLAARSES